MKKEYNRNKRFDLIAFFNSSLNKRKKDSRIPVPRIYQSRQKPNYLRENNVSGRERKKN